MENQNKDCTRDEIEPLKNYVMLTPDIVKLLDKICAFYESDPTIVVSSFIKNFWEDMVRNAGHSGLKYINATLSPIHPLNEQKIAYLKQVKEVMNPPGPSMTKEDWENAKKMALEMAKVMDQNLPGEEWKKQNDESEL